MCVYLITNLVNGKFYVGQTVLSLRERWNQHVKNAKYGDNSYLYKAMRKYGESSFTMELLCETSSIDKLNEFETLWIILLRSSDPKIGYNLTLGGHGCRANEETKRKLSQFKKQQWIDDPEGTKEIHRKAAKALSDKLTGVPKTKDHKDKISNSWNIPRKQSQSSVATRVNLTENTKLHDYTCPKCGAKFIQVTKGVYGGHRRYCLHFK